MLRRTLFGCLMSLGCLVALTPGARADMITFTTVAGSDSDGPLAATIAFTAAAGGIDVTLTNTETGTFAKGQAISSLSFTLSGLSTPTAFTELTGRSFNPSSGGSWTSSSGTPLDDTSSSPPINAIDHWGFSPSGANVLLATANSPVPGAGNPQYMILPSSGTAGPGNSLANSNFDPFIIGPATFFLATANSPVPGAGNPQYMILPSSGTAGPGNSLANSNFDPFIIGPATFFLT